MFCSHHSLLDHLSEKKCILFTLKFVKQTLYCTYKYLGGLSDMSLSWPTSRCCRTVSIVSLERGDCSCAELQVFSSYRGWEEAWQATRVISTTWRCELSWIFFFLQGKVLKEIHAILRETLGEHASSYATVKKCVAQFKYGDFFHLRCALSWTTQNSDHPGYYDQIHELILEDRQILAKCIGEQLGISREQVGSIMKIGTCGSSPLIGSQNVWTRIKNVNGASRLSNFWNLFSVIQMISCHNWWPWMKPGYITVTWTQSNNQWSSSIAAYPAPKYSECKNPLKMFSHRLHFLGSRRHPRHWLSSKGPNYQRGVSFIFAGATEGHWGKTPHEGHQGEFCSCTMMPWLTGHMQLIRNWPTWAPYSPDVALPDYHLFPQLKKQLKVAIFRPTQRSLLTRRPGWADKILIFLEWLAKVKAMG